MDLEAELQDLKRRVGDLEGTVNILTGQMRSIYPELAAMRDDTNRRFDSASLVMDRVVSRLDTLNTQVWGLRDDLPEMLDQALKRHGERGA